MRRNSRPRSRASWKERITEPSLGVRRACAVERYSIGRSSPSTGHRFWRRAAAKVVLFECVHPHYEQSASSGCCPSSGCDATCPCSQWLRPRLAILQRNRKGVFASRLGDGDQRILEPVVLVADCHRIATGKPTLRWEYPLLHLLNFLIFIVALGGFEFFWNGLLTAEAFNRIPSRHEGPQPLPTSAVWILGYALFI